MVIFLASMIGCVFPLASGWMTLIVLVKAVWNMLLCVVFFGLVWLYLLVVLSHLFVGVAAEAVVVECCYFC